LHGAIALGTFFVAITTSIAIPAASGPPPFSQDDALNRAIAETVRRELAKAHGLMARPLGGIGIDQTGKVIEL